MNKVFVFLKNLSVSELKQFQHFLESDFFNKKEDVRKLFDYWKRHSKNTKKEAAFTYVFPNRPFDSSAWNFLTSRLFKLGEQFVAVKTVMKEPLQQKEIVSDFYRKRKLPSFYKTNFIEKKKLLEKHQLRDEQWLQQSFYTEFSYYDYIASQNRKVRTNLQAVTNNLDAYFLANKLKIACLSISRQNINQEIYEIKLLKEALEAIEEDENYLEEPSVKVYYYCYKAVSKSDERKWFTLLREAMTTYQNHFSPADCRDIYLLAISYCVRQLNSGKLGFIRETLELYRLCLESGFLLEDGILAESTFINIVTLCIRLEEFDWARDFIQEHQKSLKPTFQQPLYFYSLGKLFYAQKQFDKSLRHLIQVDTKAKFLLIGTKVLQLKIYFETKELELLESLLENFRVYLQRQKELGFQKKNYEFMISCVKRLLALPYRPKEEKEVFRKEVLAKDFFTEREWVLEQI